jgi:hypothetical protein
MEGREMGLTTAPGPEQVKQFLYGEMSEEEAQVIEERLFVDTEFFYALTSLENELIDRYVQGRLTGEELKRFERSLTKSDERREQVKNARALQRVIAERKKAASAIVPHESQRPPIRPGLINYSSPSIRYAMAGLVVLLGVSVAWLLYANHQARQHLAEARGEQAQRERELQKDIEDHQQQIKDLRRKLDEQIEKNKELGKVFKPHDAPPALPNPGGRSGNPGSRSGGVLVGSNRNRGNGGERSPTITSIGGRGGAEAKVINHSNKSVTVRLPLETETDYGAYEIKTDDNKIITTGERVISGQGKKYLIVRLPAKSLKFSVIGINSETGAKKTIDDYKLELAPR